MRQHIARSRLLIFVVVTAGCVDLSDVLDTSKGTVTQPAANEAAPSVAAPPAVVPAPDIIEPAAAPVNALPIQLRTGVALPQTGPNGTLMSFSVDYQFNGSGPAPEKKYVWVVERGAGTAKEQSVELKGSGNLSILIEGWRPAEEPFRSHIVEVGEDGSRRTVSNSIDMR